MSLIPMNISTNNSSTITPLGKRKPEYVFSNKNLKSGQIFVSESKIPSLDDEMSNLINNLNNPKNVMNYYSENCNNNISDILKTSYELDNIISKRNKIKYNLFFRLKLRFIRILDCISRSIQRLRSNLTKEINQI